MYLGIDVGTSGVKAILVDDEGRVAAQATAPLTCARPHPLWSEQNPEDWWDSTNTAVRALDGAARARVRAVGLAGQMHGATLLDADDRVLRPAILWNDGRSTAECETLERVEPSTRVITGNMAMPGFTAPKLLWVRAHENGIFNATRTVLLPKDYVRLRMTGDKATDVSDAAGTLWLDTGARAWSEAMLAATGLTLAQMPALHEGNRATGALRAEVAAHWGVPRVPVAAGGGDNAAGAVGAGVVAAGGALLSLGTSGVIFVATGAFRPNAARAVHAFCHCLPGLWHQMSVHLSAAACIDWAARQLNVAGPAEMFALAEQAGPGRGPELFLPFLSGERTPHNDPYLRAAWLGCDHETTPARLAAAVLEGVAFAHADGLDALREAGTAVSRLRVIGGGARSLYWGRIIASVLGVELVYTEGGEVGPALGAAYLARLALTGEAASARHFQAPVRAVVVAEADLAARLGEKRDRYRRAVAALRQN